MLFDIKLNILVKENDDPVMKAAVNMAIEKVLKDPRLISSIAIKFKNWSMDFPDEPKTQIIVEARFI